MAVSLGLLLGSAAAQHRVSDPDRMLSEAQRAHIAEMLDAAKSASGCGLDASVLLSSDAEQWEHSGYSD